jgi:hypothetical protein
MAQRGASGFVIGGTNHGAILSEGGASHGDVRKLHRRKTTAEGMEAIASYEDVSVIDDEAYKLHRLGFGQDWVMVWLPEFVKDEDAMFFIVDKARGDEWGRQKS